MDFLDLAASAAQKFTRFVGKSSAIIKTTPEIPDAAPVCIKNNGSERFRVGFAKKVVFPDNLTKKNYYMAGYRINNVIKGANDPQTVSAMWLDCDTDEGIILVSVDAVGLTGHDVNAVRASLADFCAESGCRYIDISCTHTHAGIDTVGYWGPLPFTGKNKKFMTQLFDAIRFVCRKAYAERKSGRLYTGFVHMPETIAAGRYPYTLNDKLSRLRFVPDDGGTETWLLNYNAHPEVLGGSNSTLSSDCCYFVRNAIYREKKVNVLCTSGAVASTSVKVLDEDRWKSVRMAGDILGKAALGIDNDEELHPEISFIHQKYFAPVDNSILALMPMIGVCTTDIVPHPNCETGLALITEMTYLKIGSQKILVLPGEIFTEIVYGGYADAENSATGTGPEVNPTPYCEICGDPNLMILGISNDMTGYIVPPNDWILHPTQPYLSSVRDKFDRNHYNETNSIGIKMASIIEANFRKMAEKI